MHRLALVMIAFAIGAALNVGIASLCAMYSAHPNFATDSQVPVSFPATFWQRHAPEQWQHPPHGHAAQYSTFGHTMSILVRLDSPLTESPGLVVSDFGWPARSLRSFDFNGGGKSFTSATWTLPHTVVRKFHPYRTQLPAAVLPLGFLANSAFYAVLLSMPFVLLRHCLRLSRSRRGLCPICTYPCGSSSTCPECGHHIRHHVVA